MRPWGVDGHALFLKWVNSRKRVLDLCVCEFPPCCVCEADISFYLLPEKVWALYSGIAIEFLVSTDKYSGRILDLRLTSGVHPATLPGEWWSLGPGNAWVWRIWWFPCFLWLSAVVPHTHMYTSLGAFSLGLYFCSYSYWFFLKYKMKMSGLT